MTDCRWDIAAAGGGDAALLGAALGVSHLTARCLANRGFSNEAAASRFLNPKLKDLSDPYGLPDMAAAVSRLWRARANAERVAVFGDYDVDGVTATALLLGIFSKLGLDATHYLPKRFEEGYGLSLEAAANCLSATAATLIVAVDCGTSSVDAVAWLRSAGREVIVLDHHLPSASRPDVLALINPHASVHAGTAGVGGHLELCSAGLAFKLSHALLKHARAEAVAGIESIDLMDELELVALGSIADLAPLTGENRMLVAAGLKRMQQTNYPGIAALCQVADIRGPIGTYEIAFQLGPRLNAAGRLEGAETALQVLLSRDYRQAESLARTLDVHNRERQEIERKIAAQALERVRAIHDPNRDRVVVVGDANWHLGVVGIVAARVAREFYRPTLVLGGSSESEWRGSGRSIPGFDLAAALEECHGLLLRHGGHAMAAGLSIAPDRIEELRLRLNEIGRQKLRPEQLKPALHLDSLTRLGEITDEQMHEFDRFKPSGQGNPVIQLAASRVRVKQLPLRMGKEKQHARFTAIQETAAMAVVCWNRTELPEAGAWIDIAFEPQWNNYNGRTSIQLRLLDWRPSLPA